MPTENKICVRQICFMILSCCLIGKILVAPALGARYASEGLWISFLINFCADGAFVFFVLKLSDKFPDKTFSIYSKTRSAKFSRKSYTSFCSCFAF